jgi:hypothetical protein
LGRYRVSRPSAHVAWKKRREKPKKEKTGIIIIIMGIVNAMWVTGSDVDMRREIEDRCDNRTGDKESKDSERRNNEMNKEKVPESRERDPENANAMRCECPMR